MGRLLSSQTLLVSHREFSACACLLWASVANSPLPSPAGRDYLSVRAVHQNPKGAKLGALAVHMCGVSVHELTVPGCPEAGGVGPAATKEQRGENTDEQGVRATNCREEG